MACCLMSLATLYIMEWQNQHNSPYFRGAVLIQMKSPSIENATAAMQNRVPVMSTLFPSILLSSQASFLSSRKDTPDSAQGVSPKQSTKSGPKLAFPTPTPDDRFYGGDLDCSPEECPVFCCENPTDPKEDILPFHEDEGHHIEKKSGHPRSEHQKQFRIPIHESVKRRGAQRTHSS
ncbi:myelin regulatory factor [Caerostris darwini]|uniref:Myelin regulatory factor n=1 Tax=Caerostris darwini TaxID=1538125 RepID=A0AAV4SCW3_9ARAC|nr:myelin regulatory factor [Caerostris darwini]